MSPLTKGSRVRPNPLEEVGNEYDALVGLGSGDNLFGSRKPVLDIGGQIPSLPELRNILLCDRGSHPLALMVGSGHDRRSGVLRLELWVLELRVQDVRAGDRRVGLGSFIKGEEYQASPNVVVRDLPKNTGSCQRAWLDYPYPY